MFQEWLDEEGGMEMDFLIKTPEHFVTKLEETPWYDIFKGVAKKFDVNLVPEIFPAATDSRYFRAAGLPCIGFSPIRNTEILLHDHNEYIGTDVYLEGIEIYKDLIPKLANVPNF
eukprot:TRINITY_DN12178_c0_g1_i1.p1 TRINITY_DN12178_c0_g1~~TRINITY_DN12178_c0_g1_i1.p1  ORF type:complete len:115 (+),score=27.55 TRINITY_DN12178_c0_g1_i1:110-454(+)